MNINVLPIVDIEGLREQAQDLYDRHIESGYSFEMFAREFDRFELHFLWVDLCENGAAYDDEVYEALYDLGYFDPKYRTR